MSEHLAMLLRGSLREVLLRVEDEMGPNADLNAAGAIARSAWSRALDGAIGEELERIYRVAYRAVSPDGPLLSGAHVAARRADLLTVVDRLLAAVQEDVRAAQGDGRSLSAVAAERLEDMAGETFRVDRIAATEESSARNAGRYDAFLHVAEVTGERDELVWRAHDDDRTRETHDAADGQSRFVGEPFQVGAAHLRFPGDPLGPPEEIVNCRCELEQQTYDLTAGGTVTTPTLAVPTLEAGTTPGTEPTHSGPPDGWEGCLAPLNTLSADGRAILRSGDVPNSRPLPMEMGWQKSNEPGHAGAVTAARIDRVWYETDCAHSKAADCLHGEGAFDLGSDDGLELARRTAEGFAGQVSVDLIDVTAEWRWLMPDGTQVDEPDSFEEFLDLLAKGAEEVMYATEWQLGSTTFVSIPAFAEARVRGVWGYKPSVPSGEDEVEAALVASLRGEHVYDSVDFEVPEARSLTPITITDDGKVYGHLAGWRTCHVGFSNICQMAPKSKSGYGYFHVGAVATEKGELPVGKITVGGGHADGKAGVIPTMAHYDNAATAVAVVRAVDGKHGIWVSGSIIPEARPEDIAAMRRSPLSGDWRRVGGSLDLVAALAVNVPGFPVPRTLAASIGGEQVSLVAAGVVPQYADEALPSPTLDAQAFARAVLLEMRRQQEADAKAEALARRLGLDLDSRADRLAARVGINPGGTDGADEPA